MQSTLLARKSFPLPVGIVSRHCGWPVRPGVVLVYIFGVSEIQACVPLYPPDQMTLVEHNNTLYHVQVTRLLLSRQKME